MQVPRHVSTRYLLAMMAWGLRLVVRGRTALRNEEDAVRPPLRETFPWGRARVGRAPFRSVVLRGRTPAPQHRAPDERQARGLRRPPLEAARSRLLTFDGARRARRPAEGAPRASGSPHRAPDDERALARAAVGASRGGCRPGAAASRRQPRATPAGSEGRRSRERTRLAGSAAGGHPPQDRSFWVEDGTVTYVDADPAHPIRMTSLRILANDIRNVQSKPQVYPSPIHAEATLFGSGRGVLDGHAAFLAEPYPGFHALFRLDAVPLDALSLPVLTHTSFVLKGGVLAASGELETSPAVRNVRLSNF